MSASRDFRCAACVFGVLTAVLTTACASTGGVPRPFPMPAGSAAKAPRAPAAPPAATPNASEPAPTDPRTPSPDSIVSTDIAPGAYALVGTALNLRGTPYRNGGSDITGFDCSGFTQYVFAQHGVLLPREVRDQYRLGASVNPDRLVAGDLLFFATTDPGASHVAIAIGGDEFVHAPSSTGVVRVEHLGSSYWSPRFLGAKRVN
jgi:cell wall-associated NlpC family hydrolase